VGPNFVSELREKGSPLTFCDPVLFQKVEKLGPEHVVDIGGRAVGHRALFY